MTGIGAKTARIRARNKRRGLTTRRKRRIGQRQRQRQRRGV